MRLKTMLKIKTRSCRCDINRPRRRHGHKYTKYKMCLSIVMAIVVNNTHATFEAQFMKMLSNTEADLKKSVVYKKSV